MSVGSLGVAVSYAADGVTVNFNYPDYLFDRSHLVVTTTDVNGVVTNYVLNGAGATGFTFAGTLDTRAAAGATGPYPNGGTVTFNTAPTAGVTILIGRLTPKTQAAAFIDNSALPSASLEWALDKLTLIEQEATLFLGVSDGTPAANGTTDGQWYLQTPQAAGGNFGWVWVAAAAAWKPFGAVSL